MTGALDLLPRVLAAVAPHLTPDQITTWAAALSAPMRSSGIVTARRIAMFLGQAAEESGGFLELVEDLDYSVKGILAEWPSRFPTAAAAAPYARNPQALANTVYANRGGNGPPESGDGWRFRGRGIFQVTFRDAYTAFAASVGRELTDVIPWMETPAGAAQSACQWWADRGHMNDLAEEWDIRTVTVRINGGITGLAGRVTSCGTALAVLTDLGANTPPPAPPAPPAPAEPAPAQDEADVLDAQYNPGA